MVDGVKKETKESYAWNGISKVDFPIAGLNDLVEKVPPVVAKPTKEKAVYTLNWLSATGSGILLAAILAGLFFLTSMALAWLAVETKPNFVLCMADDQGWGDVAYNGNRDVQTPVLDEIAKSGVRHAVAISSLGGERPSGTGPIAGLHAQEERLKRLTGTNVLVLRPGFFFENFLHSLDLIRHQGINGGGAAGRTTLPMIATQDIAAFAALALAARDWSGFQVRELLGQRDLSFDEATRIIGAKIGKPDLAYVQFPYADYSAALQQAGISKSVADAYAEMEKAFDDGIVKSIEGRTAANSTPTTFEQFAEGIAQAYHGAARAAGA